MWVHVFDAHEPYDPPAAFRAKYKDAYDAEIAYVDATLGKLLDGLKARKSWENTFAAVMADHGEAFGEHGERTHGVFLYDTTIHVPLILKFPRGQFAGKRAGGRVGLVDVAPTILQAAGLPIPKEMNGQSLAALLTRDPEREAPSYSETKYPANAFGWSAMAALRTGNYLYIRAPKRELYDMAADPEASRNLAASNKALADRLARQLENFEKFYKQGAPAKTEAAMDPRLTEKLAALGYVASGSANKDVTGADPKDKIEVANQLHLATLFLEDHEYDRAIPILLKIVATDPQIFVAQTKLGGALFEVGDARGSIPHLQKATEIQSDSGQAHYLLARSFLAMGDAARAVGHFEIAVTRIPTWAQAQFLLGSTYAGLRQPGKAVETLRTAAKLDPEHYGAHLLLGRILAVEGQPAQGLPYLERATLLRPDSREAFRFLGDCYQQLGRTDDAARARAKAASLPGPQRPASRP